MSEKNESDVSSSVPEAKELVGDILRKERITRRITVETIAKDLRLNVRYIKSLEASEYPELPADPYVRVYLRSLAKYLGLKPEEIIKKFYEERGMTLEPLQKDASQKIEINVAKKETQKNPMLIVAIVLIALLAGFTLISNKHRISSSAGASLAKIKTPADTAKKKANDSIIDDSMYSGAPVQPAESTGVTAGSKDSTQKAIATKTGKDSDLQTRATSAVKVDSLSFKLSVLRDSVWVQVFSDGQSWKNYLHKGQTKQFMARDSFNIHVGNNTAMSYRVDDKPLKIKGRGVVAFKLDKSGDSVWSVNKWNSVFKDRQ